MSDENSQLKKTDEKHDTRLSQQIHNIHTRPIAHCTQRPRFTHRSYSQLGQRPTHYREQWGTFTGFFLRSDECTCCGGRVYVRRGRGEWS